MKKFMGTGRLLVSYIRCFANIYLSSAVRIICGTKILSSTGNKLLGLAIKVEQKLQVVINLTRFFSLQTSFPFSCIEITQCKQKGRPSNKSRAKRKIKEKRFQTSAYISAANSIFEMHVSLLA